MQGCLRFNPNDKFPVFDCHFVAVAIFFALVPLWLMIQDPVRLYMQFLPSSSLSLFRPFTKTCLSKFTINGSIYWSCLGSTILKCWFLNFIARTLVFIREILVENFGSIFWSELFLKSSKISWPVYPFMSINSVNKSMYQRVCFQSG